MARVEHDAYLTPGNWAKKGIELLPEANYSIAIDPGAGEGVWGKFLKERFPDVYVKGVDIRELDKPYGYSDWKRADVLNLSPADVDLVVGNSPYIHALKFITWGLDSLRPGGRLIYLLRSDLMGSQKRYPFWQKNPQEYVYMCANRPSFTGSGTDRYNYSFFIWRKQDDVKACLDWVYVE